MADTIQFWLTCDHPPVDFYQLLGKQRLDPHRESLLQAARDAFRQLHNYQTHDNRRSAEAARTLSGQVSEAITVFSDEVQLKVYEQQVTQQLLDRFVSHGGASVGVDQPSQLRSWLSDHESVHPGRIDELLPQLVAVASTNKAISYGAAGEPTGQKQLRKSDLFSRKPLLPSPPDLANAPVMPQRTEEVGDNGAISSQSPPPPKPPPRRSRPPQRRRSGMRDSTAGQVIGTGAVAKPVESQLSGVPTSARSSLASPVPVQHDDRATGNSGLIWVVAPAIVTGIVMAIAAGVFIIPRLRPPVTVSQTETSPSTETVDRDVPSPPEESSNRAAASESENTPPQDASPGDEPDAEHGSRSRPDSQVAGSGEDDGRESPESEPHETTATASTESPSDEAAASNSADAPEPTEPEPSETPVAETETSGESESQASATSTESESPPETHPSAPSTPPTAAVTTITHSRPVAAVAWSPDGTQVASAGDDRFILVTNANNGQKVAELTGLSGSVSQLAWHQEGQLLASTSVDGTARVWTLGEEQTHQSVTSTTADAFNCACWQSEGSKLFVGTSGGRVLRYDKFTSNEPRQSYEECAAAGPIVSLSATTGPQSQLLATAHMDGTIEMRLTRNGALSRLILPITSSIMENEKLLSEFPARVVLTPTHRVDCKDLSLHPNGQTLAVVNGDVCLWDLRSSRATIPLRTLPGKSDPTQGYRSVAWSPDGKYLACGDATGGLNVWETEGWLICSSIQCGGRVNALAWRPTDGKQLAVACGDNVVRIFDLGPPNERRIVEPESVFSVSEVIAAADGFLEDEEYFALRRAVDLLSMYRISSSINDSLQRYIFALRNEAKDRLEDALTDDDSDQPVQQRQSTTTTVPQPRSSVPVRSAPERTTAESRADSASEKRQQEISFVFELHDVIQLDPLGESGQKARELLESKTRPGRSPRP